MASSIGFADAMDASTKGNVEPKESTTNGSVTVEGHAISYRAVAGTLTLKNAKDEPAASMFYVAYFQNGAPTAGRPITFFYNGGPGAPAAYLHMGAFGPMRARIADIAHAPPPPYPLVNNDYSLLDATDMVFIDAPGTGYSRVLTPDLGGKGDTKDYYGIDEDGRAFSAFIQKFLSKYGRWNSPKYLFGESYGGMRSSVLALDLENASVDLNGVILLSAELNIAMRPDLESTNPSIDVPYALNFPSQAAIAWYHGKVMNKPTKLEDFLAQAEKFAMGDYLTALNAGTTLDPAAKRHIAEEMHAYDGLPVDYLLKANLRVDDAQFAHELLSDSGELTGYYDGRFTGAALDPLNEYADHDPLTDAVDSAYNSAQLDYLHGTLKFDADETYIPFNTDLNRNFDHWNYKHVEPGVGQAIPNGTNVLPDLAAAMSENPRLKLLLNTGYYDLALPFYGEVFQLQHLPMDDRLQANISYAFYPTGHMMYDSETSLKALHDNVARFIVASHSAPASAGP
jgi:carboxypeptidase C (cathepsin A)